MPPAPPTFSTMTCWPNSSERRDARTRVRTSPAPPAASGTTIDNGRIGQLWAAASSGANQPNATPLATILINNSRLFMGLAPLLAAIRKLVGTYEIPSRTDNANVRSCDIEFDIGVFCRGYS